MINSLRKGLEAKNMETEEHTERVEKYALEIGKRYGFKTSQVDELMLVAKVAEALGKFSVREGYTFKTWSKLTKNLK